MKNKAAKSLILTMEVISCFCILFTTFALPAYSAEKNYTVLETVKPRAKDQNARVRLRESSKRLIDALDKGNSDQTYSDNVMEDISALEAGDADAQKRFDEIGNKLKSSGSSKAWRRHQETLEKYRRAASEVKLHVEALREAKKRKAAPSEIARNARSLVGAIDKDGASDDYKLKDSSRLPWRVVGPGDIVLLGDTASMPGQGSQPPPAPPVATDLSSTADVQITPEIQELANSLGNQPLQIFRHVYNNYNFTPYYGSMKGSLDTYWEKEGNDYDLSSLLIALLRASGVPSRYVKAKIILPIDAVRKWVGIDDPMTALIYLSSAKIPTGYYTQGGGISHVEIEHVYVEAYVPYSNYRGTGEDDSGKLWLPFDPSFKKYSILQEGIDLTSLMGLGWKTFSNEYLGEIRNSTPMEYYRGKVDGYISQNYPGQSIDSLKRITEISKMQFDFLPNTLPYRMKEVIERFAEIPQGFRHNLRFTIPNVLDYSTSLPEVSGRRITLSFEGATSDDQTVIDQFGGVFNTPPYLIQVKPVLRINGNRTAEGVPMNAGIDTSFSITYTQTEGKTDTFDHHIVTGSYNAVGITTGNVRPEFLSIAEVEASEEPYISKMLHSLVMKYHDSLSKARQTLNGTMGMKSKTFFTEALVSSREDRKVIFGGISTSFDLAGFMIDAKEMATVSLPVDGKDMEKKQIDFAMMYGYEASYQENRTFEDSMFWVSGLSAVKGLQLLKEMGVSIMELNPPMDYFNPNLPQAVVSDINNALNMGWSVIVPEETGGLPAVPFIKYDPATGSAGYMIATAAGGYTWNITPTGYEADLTFVKNLFMSNNITIKYQVLSPSSPYFVSMGDSFMIRWRITAEAEAYGVRSVHDQMIIIDTDRTHYNLGKWPLYALLPGTYTIKFDGNVLFDFFVWGVVIDPSASDNSLEIVIKNGIGTISRPMIIAYNIIGAPGLNLNLAEMTIRGNGIIITKTLPSTSGQTTTTWDGKDNNGNFVPPGDYTVEILAQGPSSTGRSNIHTIVVSVVDCDNTKLISAYAHTINTFVAVRDDVKLEGSADGSNCSFKYRWNFDDGATSDQQSPYHFYQAEGIYFPTLTATCDKCNTPPVSSTEKVVVGCPPAILSNPDTCCALSPRKLIPNYPIQDLAQCPNRVPNITSYVPTFNGCGGAAGVSSAVPNNPMLIAHAVDPAYQALYSPGAGDFTTSCNGHDLCYGRCNAIKNSCDINLGLDIDAVCYNDFSGAYLIECLAFSTLYEYAVTTRGDSFFEDGQKAACNCCKQ